MRDVHSWSEVLRLLLELTATLAFALSGLMEAARKRLDAVGVCVVAFLAAFGGGTLRDLLLDQRPFFWVRHVNWLWGLLLLCAAAMLFMRNRHFEPTERAIQWPDALGLGLDMVSGGDLAIAGPMRCAPSRAAGSTWACCTPKRRARWRCWRAWP